MVAHNRAALHNIWNGMDRLKFHARTTEFLIGGGVALLFFVVYVWTLLPGVGGGDTAELQRVGPTLGLAHSTGYPLYTLLGWAWSRLVPLGSPAWRMNLLSALSAALAIGGIYAAARILGQERVIAAGVALALGVSRTFWEQATHAEVYALSALLHGALLLALLLWRRGTTPLWVAGLALGLGLAHHRTIILWLPGVLGFVLLTRRPRWRELSVTLGAAILPLLLYLYVPLRAPPWQDRRQLLRAYLLATDAGQYLDPARLRAEGAARISGLLTDLVVPQFTIVGVLLMLLGAIALVRRDRALALLVLLSYALVFAFGSAYYVPDLDVFLLSAHLLAALLIGDGARLLLTPLPRLAPRLSTALLILPLILAARNAPAIRRLNTAEPEIRARQLLAQPIEPGALLIGDGWTIESLRYLQAVEGARPDIEFGFNADRRYITDSLSRGRAVYLLQAVPDLGLAQQPAGDLVRVTDAPLQIATPRVARWQDGLGLRGFTLQPGPYRADAIVPLTVAWAAETQPQQGYTVFVHLVDQQGTLWGQYDKPPQPPTDQWQPQAEYLDLYLPRFKPDTPPGRYRVLIGWYSWPSLAKLPVLGGASGEVEYVVLGEIEVAP